MVFAFETPALHKFYWRTSLDRREVPENLFSTSFGWIKVAVGDAKMSKIPRKVTSADDVAGSISQNLFAHAKL